MTSVLAEGQQAPLFTLPDQHAAERPLSDFLAQGPVVLFFYPAASTPVCTAQACHFRDLAAEFAELGAVRVGISTDSVAKQGNFASRQGFDYPLLSDADGSVAAAFGVKRGLLGALAPVKRTTFVIEQDGTIGAVIKSEFNANAHADDALAYLRKRG
jgi:peroxiredoxin Q/BCP